MISRRLAGCPMVVCASPDYLQRHGRPKRVRDLKEHNCLGYTLLTRGGAGRWLFGKSGSARVSVKGNLKANNGDALVAAAIAGQGIIQQPAFLVSKEIDDGLLEPIELDCDPLEMAGIYVVYPADRSPPAKVRAMIEFLSERLTDYASPHS